MLTVFRNLLIRLTETISVHFFRDAQDRKSVGIVKKYGKLKILNGHEKVKEGTSRGDTTTNLRNFSSRIFLARTETLEKPTLGRLGRKHDK